MRISSTAPRAILYGRVSKDQRGGRSVNQQLKIGDTRAGERGWNTVGRYADNDQSASQYARGQREDWQQVQADIDAGLADILWVWEISRGTRERLVWANLAASCQRHQMYIAIDDKLYDTTDPDDMRYLDGLIADAIAESGRTRKRILRDMEAAAEEGKPHGPLGFGYRREYDPQTREFLRQVPDEEQAPIVREIARRYLAGEPLRSIAVDLNQRGVPTERGRVAGQAWTTKTGREYQALGWSTKILRGLLERPSLIGKRGYNGRIIEPEDTETWVPILDETDWWTIQERLTSPKSRGMRGGRARWWLSGVAICDVCEGPVRSSGAVKLRSTGKEVNRYGCVGRWAGDVSGHVSRRADLLQTQAEALIVAKFSRPDVLEAFTRKDPDADDVAEAQARTARLRAQRDALYEDVRTGRVSRLMAQADEDRITRELASLEATARPRSVEPAAVELAQGSPDAVMAVWDAWTVDQKRAALKALTEEIRVLQVGKSAGRDLHPSESIRIRWLGE